MQASHCFAGLRGLPCRILHWRSRRWRVDRRQTAAPPAGHTPDRSGYGWPHLRRRGRHVAAAPRGGRSSADRRRWREDRRGGGRLPHAVQLIVQVGDGEMNFAIGAIRRRRNGRRVSSPHRRGGAEGGEQLRRRLAAWRMTCSSLPSNPRSRSRRRFGRGCGGRIPCTNPRSARAFILYSPCSAAFLGLERPSRLFCEASLPTESPA